MQQQELAILFFSRNASQEASQKSFVNEIGWKGNRAVAERLISKAQKVGRSTQYPLFSCFENDQRGSSFGERLSNAIEDIYRKGFEHVIVIGNDCPSLSTELLEDSARLLIDGQLVLGPAKDGGLFLIGISKENYDPQAFRNLPWESENLHAAFQKYSTEISVTSYSLAVLSDIDNSIDFRLFLQSLLPIDSIGRVFRSIIASFGFLCPFFENFTSPLPVNSQVCLRAP